MKTAEPGSVARLERTFLMAIQISETLRLKPLRALFLFHLIFLSCAGGTAPSDQVVARDLGAFFEAFLERKLSNSELRAVVDEFIRIHASEGKNRAAIHQIANSFDYNTKLLRNHKGSPGALT